MTELYPQTYHLFTNYDTQCTNWNDTSWFASDGDGLERVASAHSSSPQQDYTDVPPGIGFGQSISPVKEYSRSKTLPAADWERLRPIILQLYINDERQLEDVRRIVRQLYDFDATPQMYKKRLARWKIRKNYSRQQKDEVLRVQDHGLEQGTNGETELPGTLLNNKHIKQHRIERYRRQKQKDQNKSTCLHLSSFHPQQSQESRSVEMFLIEAKYYSNWCFSQSDHRIRLTPSITKSNICSYILLGTTSLRFTYGQAFALFDKACSEVSGFLQDHDLLLFYDVLNLFGNERLWDSHADARTALLVYFCQMAQYTLGPFHPISKMMSVLVTRVPWTDLMLRLSLLLLDTAARSANGLSHETSVQFQWGVISSPLTGGRALCHHAAQRLPQLIQRIESLVALARSTSRGRIAYFHLAGAGGGKLQAERLWLRVIELGVQHVDWVASPATENIATGDVYIGIPLTSIVHERRQA